MKRILISSQAILQFFAPAALKTSLPFLLLASLLVGFLVPTELCLAQDGEWVDLIRSPSSTHFYLRDCSDTGPKSIDGDFTTFQGCFLEEQDGKVDIVVISEYRFSVLREVRQIKYRLEARAVGYSDGESRRHRALYGLDYAESTTGTNWIEVPGMHSFECGGDKNGECGNDTGVVTIDVDLPTVGGIRVIALAQGDAGESGYAYGEAKIYAVEAYGVLDAPTITTELESLSVIVGQPAQFTVQAAGSAPLDYEWRFNGGLQEGQTGADFTIPAVSSADAGVYSVEVKNDVGSTVSEATLNVLEPPSILLHPQPIEVHAGTAARFHVRAEGTWPLDYEWQFDGSPMIPRETGADLVIPAALKANEGAYSVIVRNEFGEVESDSAALTVVFPEKDISDLSNLMVIHGKAVQFQLTAASLSQPVTFSMRTDYPPHGLMTLDQGVFTYIPASEDLNAFEVTFTAEGADGQTIDRTITVTPYPLLPPEDDVLRASYDVPEEDSADYIVRSSITSEDKEDFNGFSRYTRSVEVSGITLDLRGGHPNHLFDLNGNEDVKSLSLTAERIVLGDNLDLPGTALTLRAQRVEYEDDAEFTGIREMNRIETFPGWFTPAVSRMFLRRANDLVLYGHYTEARDALVQQLGWLDDLMALPDWWLLPEMSRLEFGQMRGETFRLLHLIDSNRDKFGHPVGWVPLLSFEVNDLAFENEIDRAIPVLYLAYWLEHVEATLINKASALVASRVKLSEEINAATDQLDHLQDLLPQLESEASSVVAEIEHAQELLRDRLNELIDQMTEAGKKEKESGWRRVVRTVGNILSALPIVGPVTTAIGEGLQAVADFDPDDPIGSLIPVARRFGEANFDQAAEDFRNTMRTIDPRNVGDLEDYLRDLKPIYDDVSTSIEKIREILKPSEVSSEDAQAIINQLKAEHPEFNEVRTFGDPLASQLLDRIAELVGRKESLAQRIADATREIGELTDQIVHNTLAIDGLNRGIADKNAVLDHRAMTYVKDMEQRAKERLRLYNYMLAKSYEYRFLEQYPGELNLQDFFDRIIPIVEEAGDKELTPADFDVLKNLYLDLLAEVTFEILRTYNQNPPPRVIGMSYRLNADQLTSLNAGEDLNINLMHECVLPTYEENQRILDVTLDATYRLKGPVTTPSAMFDLFLDHSGESRLRKSTRDLLFRHDMTPSDNPIWWGVRFDAISGTTTPMRISPNFKSLLKFLLERWGVPITDENLLLFARPGLWADLILKRKATPHGVLDIVEVTSLVITFSYEYNLKPANLVNLQVAPNEPGISPYMILSPEDRRILSPEDRRGRKDGRGWFSRTYQKGTEITLVAPARYGAWEFVAWTGCFGEPPPFDPVSPDVTFILDDDLSLRAHYRNTDEDSDGLPDWWEELYYGNTVKSWQADTDNDRLIDMEELLHGTSPLLSDTDCDGVCDREQIEKGEDPLALRICHFTFDRAQGELRFLWVTKAGRVYRVEWSPDLPPSLGWLPLSQEMIATTNELAFSWTPEQTSAFYRIRMVR